MLTDPQAFTTTAQEPQVQQMPHVQQVAEEPEQQSEPVIINGPKLSNSVLQELIAYLRSLPDYEYDKIPEVIAKLDEMIENGSLNNSNLDNIVEILET